VKNFVVVILLCSSSMLFAQSQHCEDQTVEYKTLHPSKTQFQMESISKDATPSGERVRTPQGTRWLVQSQPDFMKDGPWTTTMIIGDGHGAFLQLVFPNHGNGGVSSEWLNEKLLFLRIWLGRIVSIDMILDVQSRTVIYSESANYVDLIQPCS